MEWASSVNDSKEICKQAHVNIVSFPQNTNT